MFDKIPSLRDFIIYLVPGFLLTSVAFNFLQDSKLIEFEVSFKDLFVDTPLVFVFIFISFIVGFLQSQAQIQVINKIIYKKSNDIRTIEKCDIPDTIKAKIVKKIQTKFDISDDPSIRTNEEYFYLCFNYVMQRANENIYKNLNRLSYLSLFSSSIILPVTCALLYLSIKTELSIWLSTLLFAFVGSIMIIICFRAIKEFRSNWIKTVYRTFLLLDESKPFDFID